MLVSLKRKVYLCNVNSNLRPWQKDQRVDIKLQMSKTTIPTDVKRDLWFAAHGRGEFAGCNKILFQHGITMDKCNISNYAHIIGDSAKGPRGDEEKSKALSKDINNLILLCPECHKLIDSNEEKYTVEVLKKMKKDHEERILLATGIQPNMKSLIVVYSPKIGTDTPHFHKDALFNTIFPERYPADSSPIEIQMKSVLHDGESEYWMAEERQIEQVCNDKVLRALEDGVTTHISLFPLGPQPLLVKLGTVLNDKYNVRVYQKHRVPDTWRWLDESVQNDIYLEEPADKSKEPVLVLALSANAIKERITMKYRDTASIWTITCKKPENDMMRCEGQLMQFNRVARATMDAIKTTHQNADRLKIFMAVPASCAVELGRIRMPKADLPWVLYDYRGEKNEDVEAITIN